MLVVDMTRYLPGAFALVIVPGALSIVLAFDVFPAEVCVRRALSPSSPVRCTLCTNGARGIPVELPESIALRRPGQRLAGLAVGLVDANIVSPFLAGQIPIGRAAGLSC